MNEQWMKLKEWWSNLSLREKQAVGSGGSVLTVFIFYQLMWSPFLDHMALMRKKIQTDGKVLIWMEAADKQIQKVEGQAKPTTKTITPVILLGLLQKQINHAGLGQYLSNMKQGSNESVDIHFQKVEFDKLMTLLIAVIKEHHVFITQMSVTADITPGVVNADLTLSLA